ncbi:MAG: hypothetical protein Solivirus1_62 [Solivirus sp.]|jgi:hypothetical protein|uniref:Uncharacterized protein n=1 Tax=Solivirus sp. TaxID=2487772 RepID=A0A3G5AFB1_9VIRU|nr:MAG: hypothetical protein Solivirus1_62 [Solivirus sp.]
MIEKIGLSWQRVSEVFELLEPIKDGWDVLWGLRQSDSGINALAKEIIENDNEKLLELLFVMDHRLTTEYLKYRLAQFVQAKRCVMFIIERGCLARDTYLYNYLLKETVKRSIDVQFNVDLLEEAEKLYKRMKWSYTHIMKIKGFK